MTTITEKTWNNSSSSGFLSNSRKKYIARCILVAVAISSLLSGTSTTPQKRELALDQQESQEMELLTIPPMQSEAFWSCRWSPNDHKQCDQLFFNRLSNYSEQTPDRGRRYLFFGDSTVKRLFHYSDLKKVLVEDPLAKSRLGCLGADMLTCKEREGDRCELNANFGLAKNTDQWVAPDPNLFEGPARYGLENANCNDCAGCQTHFLDCRSMILVLKKTNTMLRGLSAADEEKMKEDDDGKNKPAGTTSMMLPPQEGCGEEQEQTKGGGRHFYGGYMTMEFARDTEIQSSEFRTTQENVAAYVMRTWNSLDMLQNWKKPICVLNAGNHDLLVREFEGMMISTEEFVRNVKFMLTTMKPVCEHMIWLGNTSNNQKTKYRQTKENIMRLEKGVKEMIGSEPELLSMMSYIDVIDASLEHPHADFIHMDEDWYIQLGKWFVESIILL